MTEAVGLLANDEQNPYDLNGVYLRNGPNRRYPTGERQEHRFGAGRFGREAPFAPRDGSVGDDDGYLVGFVTDERHGRSEVQILDTTDIAAGQVARVRLPQRVPLGFHATWVRTNQLRSGQGPPT